jgi:hypothetical protein
VTVRRHQRRLVAFLVLWTGFFAIVGSTAEGACPTPQPTYPFAQWGDLAPYVLAEDGSFEKKPRWRGTATTVQENDPFELAGPGKQSMRLRGDQTLTSPVLCLNDTLPHFRFVARALDQAQTSQLVVELLWKERGDDKELVLEPRHKADSFQAWAPSGRLPFASAMSIDKKKENVRLRFRVEDAARGWLVDDVFVDPVKRG